MISSGVKAAVLNYSSQAGFLGASGPVVLEDFEDEPTVGTTGSGGLTAMTFDHFMVSSSHASLKVLDAPFLGFHNTTAGGAKYFNSDTDMGGVGSTILLTFPSPITAVGFNIPWRGDLAFLVDGALAGGVTGPGWFTDVFFGIVSDTPFTILTIGSPNSHFVIDDVFSSGTAAPSVPEGGSVMPALALIVAGLGVTSRRWA